MYWPLLNMYSENFGFGPGGCFIRGTFSNRGKGLITYICIYYRHLIMYVYLYMHGTF